MLDASSRRVIPVLRWYHATVIGPPDIEPEARHRACWYGRRTPQLPAQLTIHTVEDGHLLYCAHPMLFPFVGYDFDTRNCDGCDYFKAHHARRS
jgi:hypothetical protein